MLAHLEAENAYTDAAHRAPRGSARAHLRRDQGPHARDRPVGARRAAGDWWYYSRTVEGQQYGIQCRAPLALARRLDAARRSTPGVDVPGEQVLLDGNVEAEGHEFFSLGSFDVSNDGTRLLYGVDVAGRRALHDARARSRHRRAAGRRDPGHLRRRDVLARRLGASSTRPSTTPGDPTPSGCTSVGTDVAADVTLFHEPDERYWVGAGLHPQRQVTS